MGKIANLIGYKYQNLTGNWATIYNDLIVSLKELDYKIRISPYLKIKDREKLGEVGINDNVKDLYVFNHTYPEDIEEKGFIQSESVIFIKPTGPTNKHYSIDVLGYSSRVTIAYDKPQFEDIDYKEYWDVEISKIKENKLHKWSGDYVFEENKNIPDNHVLIVGQMPGDTSVREFSFQNHMVDIDRIIDRLDSKDHIVIKLHPFLIDRSKGEYLKLVLSKISRWEALGHTVISGMMDLHTILPKTKLAIIENSTAGLECMMYDVPMITFGCPEYRWVCKELRQIVDLNKFKNDLSWFNKELSRKFLVWYTRDWLCYDKTSTIKRLKQILNL